MRSMWNGSISFGLVNIPVGLYPATTSDRVRFNLLHKEDGGRIENQRVCKKCGEVVDYDDLEKGYEYEKDHYVTVTEPELAGVQTEATETLTITAFVDLDAIDPIYFEKPYYLVPAKKADRVYALLRETLKQTHKVGIARFVLRTREYLAAIRASGDALVVDTMHFAEEIREAEGVPSAQAEVDPRELAMAKQLVEAMAEEFDAEKYHDTYEAKVLELIDKKLSGKKIAVKAKKAAPTNVIDLMSRLKASLEQAEPGSGAEKPAPVAKAPHRKAAPRRSAKPAAKERPSTRKSDHKTKLRLVA